MRTIGVIALVLAGAAGWTASWRSSREGGQVRQELAEQQARLASRDRELASVAGMAEMLAEVEGELARLRVGKPGVVVATGESPVSVRREAAVARLRAIGQWLDQQRAQLAGASERAGRLAGRQTALEAEVAAQLKTIEGLRLLADRQRLEVDSLTARLEAAGAENRRLRDNVAALETAGRRVYLAAGPRQDLIDRGLAVEEGGLSLPLAGRGFAVLVPARMLPDTAFAALDRGADTVLVLPRQDRFYRLVSRHDPALLDGASGGRLVRGRARITDPAAFWRVSPYLILEEIPPASEVWR